MERYDSWVDEWYESETFACRVALGTLAVAIVFLIVTGTFLMLSITGLMLSSGGWIAAFSFLTALSFGSVIYALYAIFRIARMEKGSGRRGGIDGPS